MTSAFSKRSEILMILVAFAAQNLIVSLEIWLFSDLNVMNNIPAFQKVKKLHSQRFRDEIKLDLQTYPKPLISLSMKH